MFCGKILDETGCYFKIIHLFIDTHMLGVISGKYDMAYPVCILGSKQVFAYDQCMCGAQLQELLRNK